MGSLIISFWWDIALLLATLSMVFYIWMKNRYSYWKKKGVSGPNPALFFGNMKKLILKKATIGEEFAEHYSDTKKSKYAGVFMMLKPTLLINDLELIKTILTKDFIHFSEHIFKINPKNDPVGDHLFNATGIKWKNMRAKMTPTFTSSKMREMFDAVLGCALEMNDFLEVGGGKQILNVKELMAKLNTDVIGTCAFGIECNSFKDPDAEFRSMGRELFKITPWRAIANLMLFVAPDLLYKSGVSILGKKFNDYFLNTVKDVVEYRTKNNVPRNDFIKILMKMRDEEENTKNPETFVDDGTKLTMAQITAQVFVFFVAGFETSSSVGSFALYELALNPDIQSKVVEEIDEMLVKYNGKLVYDSLAEMTYLTKVIEETMRKYPTLPVLFRNCTKDYIIPETNVKIEKGTSVIIPTLGIQRDPEIYPNPDKFDPERFSQENKEARHHFSYLPFGEGPRICIGSRFGLMQVKLGLAMFLSKYEVSVCEKTAIPMVFDKDVFTLSSKGGIWLETTRRKKM